MSLTEDVTQLIEGIHSTIASRDVDSLVEIGRETEAFLLEHEKVFQTYPLEQQRLLAAYRKSIHVAYRLLGKADRRAFLALTDIADADEENLPPSHLEILEFSKKISSNIGNDILSQATPERKLARAAYWLAIMLKCFNHRKYQTVYNIGLALGDARVERALKDRWPQEWEEIKQKINFFTMPTHQDALLEPGRHPIVPDLASLRWRFIQLKRRKQTEQIPHLVARVKAMQIQKKQYRKQKKSLNKPVKEITFKTLTEYAITHKSKIHLSKNVKANFKIIRCKDEIQGINLHIKLLLSNKLEELQSRTALQTRKSKKGNKGVKDNLKLGKIRDKLEKLETHVSTVIGESVKGIDNFIDYLSSEIQQLKGGNHQELKDILEEIKKHLNKQTELNQAIDKLKGEKSAKRISIFNRPNILPQKHEVAHDEVPVYKVR
ncbi:MAG: hypothetical protein EPO11_02730 [Gammaproteobacteria bacterium]|nr:MAG: hypothetical protein EPO11_02730 [Gammaproteobacteria bacterium]